MLEAIRPELLLPETELGILQTLHNENREMKASEIAGELDCSGQLVGRRAKNLSERTLVKRVQGTVYRYEITKKANDAYFADSSAAQLNLDQSE
jgi:predicted transcriptional regulator